MRSTPSRPAGSRPNAISTEPASRGAPLVVEGLTWRPIRRRRPVLQDLDLVIPAGQRVLVTGPSGAGKSTLLRALAGLLQTAAHGELSGRVLVGGRPAGEVAGQVGLLMQDPTAAIVAATVGRDVAFGLENVAVPRAEIWPRVRGALETTAFPYGPDHPTSALSGGETQRLTLAGSLASGNAVLLLDEPTSMLDPPSADLLRAAVRRDVESRGATLVVVEHQLQPWLDFVDRVLVLGRDGSIVADGPAVQVFATASAALAEGGVWVPGSPPPPLTGLPSDLVEPWHDGPANPITATGVHVELRSSVVDRHRPPTVALAGVDARLAAGHALAVTGPSGAGKSTLVAVLAGLQRPTRGDVVSAPELATTKGAQPWRWRSSHLVSRLAWVPQLPEQGMVSNSVAEEVIASAQASGRDLGRAGSRADGLLEALGLSHLRDANPYHLSGGEQRRLMVAAALAHGPFAVLLDEPTVGQDRHTWAAVLGAVAAARDAGSAVALASHDPAAIEVLADETMRLVDGVAA